MNEETGGLFTYGTLMLDNMMLKVTKRTSLPQKIKGVVRGYERLAVKGVHYPGVRHAQGEKAIVDGILWQGLSKEDMQRLDTYEGDQYYKETVQVQTDQGIVSAHIYVFVQTDKLEGPWDLSHCSHLINN
jgi:gamma-glutamylcyclotransferase (GGCT)/AIG2-like uncharacterized protein YtfP